MDESIHIRLCHENQYPISNSNLNLEIKMVVYRLSYLITCTCLLNEGESAYVSAFFFLVYWLQVTIDMCITRKKMLPANFFIFFV